MVFYMTHTHTALCVCVCVLVFLISTFRLTTASLALIRRRLPVRLTHHSEGDGGGGDDAARLGVLGLAAERLHRLP